MGEHKEGDEAEEEEAISFEFRYAQEEEADGDLRDSQRYEDLVPVEIVVLEEALEVFVREVLHMPSEAIANFHNHKAHADRIDYLPFR